MSDGYKVIARRWRPKTFNEVVGQEHVVRTLAHAIESKRIAQAFLFVGPRGTGKTTMARLLALSLNAEAEPSVEPDLKSDLARSIFAGRCLDVIEIDGASSNRVEDIRSVCDECRYAPAESTFKVYIIDEVHMLSTSASNALLKTLEEPPAHAKFILATTEAHKVLPTVVSRCQRFEFRPIEASLIAERLALIAKTEDVACTPEALAAVARLADGGMRDAQVILDQLIAFGEGAVSVELVQEVYGLVDAQQLEALAAALVGGELNLLLERALGLDGSLDLYRVFKELVLFLREALRRAVAAKGAVKLGGLEASTDVLSRVLEALADGEALVRSGLSQQVHFEMVLLRAFEAGRSRPLDDLLLELTRLAKLGGEPQAAFAEPEASPNQSDAGASSKNSRRSNASVPSKVSASSNSGDGARTSIADGESSTDLKSPKGSDALSSGDGARASVADGESSKSSASRTSSGHRSTASASSSSKAKASASKATLSERGADASGSAETLDEALSEVSPKARSALKEHLRAEFTGLVKGGSES